MDNVQCNSFYIAHCTFYIAMRTLVINSMFFNAAYRRCADELGILPDIDLTVLTVDSWHMNSMRRIYDPFATGSPYRTIIGKTWWKGKENRGFYISGLLKAFRLSRPEVIYLMEEPFSLFALQTLILRAILYPNTPVIFFTWNNLSLEKYDYRPSAWYRNVARWVLERMEYGLTANSQAIEVLRSAGNRFPMKMIGYGVDLSLFRSKNNVESVALRKKIRIDEDPFIVGYVGRMIYMKGLDLLAEAFIKLRSEMPERKIILFLLGSGEYEAELITLFSSKGIESDIRMLPSAPQNEVPAYMRMLDVLVLPSRREGMWAEQFGRVIIEAMASRTVVLGSSSGAIPEVIGDAGFVFEENNADDLLQKLRQIVLMNPEEKQMLLDRGEHRAQERYSWKRFAAQSADALRFVYNASKEK